MKNIDSRCVINHATNLLSARGHQSSKEPCSAHRDHQEEGKHHSQHNVQIIGQPSSPQRAQDGGEAPHGAPDALAEACGGERHKESKRALFGAPFSHVCCVTLGLFRRDFGEEGHLRHGHKREPQQLEEDPDDEGRQLPSVPAWRKDGGDS